jgi:hypothetical protein
VTIHGVHPAMSMTYAKGLKSQFVGARKWHFWIIFSGSGL